MYYSFPALAHLALRPAAAPSPGPTSPDAGARAHTGAADGLLPAASSHSVHQSAPRPRSSQNQPALLKKVGLA